jgi:flagellar FliL protein
MATEASEQSTENAAEGAPAPAKGKVMMMAVAGLVVGAAVGFLGVGPVLAKNKSAAPKAEAHASSHEGGESGGSAWPIENLVLNPAGSNGTRFLMVSATFEMKDEAAKDAAKGKEAEVRDALLALLGKKPIDQLTDIGQRDAIKKEVLTAVSAIFPKGTVTRVFFPQFVIQ